MYEWVYPYKLCPCVCACTCARVCLSASVLAWSHECLCFSAWRRSSRFIWASMVMASLRSRCVYSLNFCTLSFVFALYPSAAFWKCCSRSSICCSSIIRSTLRSSMFLFFISSHRLSNSCRCSSSDAWNCCSCRVLPCERVSGVQPLVALYNGSDHVSLLCAGEQTCSSKMSENSCVRS